MMLPPRRRQDSPLLLQLSRPDGIAGPQVDDVAQSLPNDLLRPLLPGHELLHDLVQGLDLRHVVAEHGLEGVRQEGDGRPDPARAGPRGGLDQHVERRGGPPDLLQLVQEGQDGLALQLLQPELAEGLAPVGGGLDGGGAGRVVGMVGTVISAGLHQAAIIAIAATLVGVGVAGAQIVLDVTHLPP